MADAVLRHEITDGSLTERWYDGDRDDVVALAPHGGSMEPHTASQAAAVAKSADIPAWTCRGHSDTDEPAFSRFHVTSSRVAPDEYPLLEHAFDVEPQLAVSFHGMSKSGIKIGGRAPTALKQHVCAELQGALDDDTTVEAVVWGPYCGITRANVVNAVTKTGEAGIQVEQSRSVRDDHSELVAETVVKALSAVATVSA